MEESFSVESVRSSKDGYPRLQADGCRSDNGGLPEARPGKGFCPLRRHEHSLSLPDRHDPAENLEPVPGEFVLFGTTLVTGDYGNQSLEIDLLMLRIVCLNLAIGYDMFRKIHLGSRFQMGEGDEIIPISQKTIKLDTDTISSAIMDVVDASNDHIKLLRTRFRRQTRRRSEIKSHLRHPEKKRNLEGDRRADQEPHTNLPQEVEILPRATVSGGSPTP